MSPLDDDELSRLELIVGRTRYPTLITIIVTPSEQFPRRRSTKLAGVFHGHVDLFHSFSFFFFEKKRNVRFADGGRICLAAR